MKKVRLLICLSLVIAIQATPKNDGRPKRDLHYIKKLVKDAIFGGENSTTEPQPPYLIKDPLGNYKMVNIPYGYKAIYIKRVPQDAVVHDVHKTSAASILESYLGTKSTQASLAALENVRKLIESGIISKKNKIESIFKLPTATNKGNNLNTPNNPYSFNDRSNADAHGYQNLPVVSEHSEVNFNEVYRPNDPVINEHEEFYSKELHLPIISASKEFADRLKNTHSDAPFVIPFTSGPPRTSYDIPLNETVAISLDPKVVYYSYKPVLNFKPRRGYSYKQIYNDGSRIYYYLNGKREVIPKVIKNVQAFRPPKFFVEPVKPIAPVVIPDQRRFVYRLIKHYNDTMSEEMIEEPSGVKLSETHFDHTVPILDKIDISKHRDTIPISFSLTPPAIAPAHPHVHIVHNAPFQHRYSYVQTNFPSAPVAINVPQRHEFISSGSNVPLTTETELTPPKPSIQSSFYQVKPLIENRFSERERFSHPPLLNLYESLPKPDATFKLHLNQGEITSNVNNTQFSAQLEQSLPEENNIQFNFNKQSKVSPVSFISPPVAVPTLVHTAPLTHKYSYVQTNFPNAPKIINLQQNHVHVNNDKSTVIEKSPEPFVQHVPSEPVKPFKEILHNSPFQHKYSYVLTNFPNPPLDNQVQVNSYVPVVVETSPEPLDQHTPLKPAKPFKEISHNSPFLHKYSYLQTEFPNTRHNQQGVIDDSTPEQFVQPIKSFNDADSKYQTTPYPLNSINSLSNSYIRPENTVTDNQVRPQFDSTIPQANKENVQTNQYSYTQTNANGNNVIYKNHEVIINENVPATTSSVNSNHFLPEISTSKPSSESIELLLPKEESLSKFSDTTELTTTEVATEALKFNLPETSTSVTFSISKDPVRRRKIYKRVNVRRNGTRPYPPKVETLSEKPIVVLPKEKSSEGSFSYKQINDDGSSRTIRLNEEEKSVVVDVNHAVEGERGDV